MARALTLIALLSAVAMVSAVEATVFIEETYVAATDFGSGGLVSLDGSGEVSQTGISIYNDSGITSFEQMIYILERSGQDNVTVIDPFNLSSTPRQFSVGNGSNPHFMEFASSTKAYISLYDRSYLLIVNPATGDSIGVVEMSNIADPDGIPELDAMTIIGSTLYVTIQRLNRNNSWLPFGSAKVAAIDTATDLVTGYYDLTIQNPAHIASVGNMLYVSGGGYGNIDSVGIDTINTQTGAIGRLVTGSAFTGRVAQLQPISGTTAYVLFSGAWPLSTIARIDLKSGVLSDTLLGLVSPAYMAHRSDGTLVVSDRGLASPGLFLFHSGDGSSAGPRISTGSLPPNELTVVDVTPYVGIPNGFAVGAPSPNPFNPSVTIPFRADSRYGVNVSIYNSAGQLVRSSHLPAGAASTQIRWNGLSDEGLKVSSGVYFVRIESGSKSAVRRVTLIR